MAVTVGSVDCQRRILQSRRGEKLVKASLAVNQSTLHLRPK